MILDLPSYLSCTDGASAYARRTNWRDLENLAPEIADLGKERLERAGVALLGSSRADGSPRISPVEPVLTGGNVVFGAMAWSQKVRDLARDSRCVLHSAITRPDQGEGELKLYGRAGKADDQMRARTSQGWWHSHPTTASVVFVLDIEEAIFVSWNLEQGEMTIRRCSSQRGYTESRRSYPE